MYCMHSIYLLKQQKDICFSGAMKTVQGSYTSQRCLNACNVVFLCRFMHATCADGRLAFVDSTRDKDKPSRVTDGCVICR